MAEEVKDQATVDSQATVEEQVVSSDNAHDATRQASSPADSFIASLQAGTTKYLEADDEMKTKYNASAQFLGSHAASADITQEELNNGMIHQYDVIGARLGIENLGMKAISAYNGGPNSATMKEALESEIRERMQSLDMATVSPVNADVVKLDHIMQNTKDGKIGVEVGENGVKIDQSGLVPSSLDLSEADRKALSKPITLPIVDAESRHKNMSVEAGERANGEQKKQTVADAQAQTKAAETNLKNMTAAVKNVTKNPSVQGMAISGATGIPVQYTVPAALILQDYAQKTNGFGLKNLFQRASDKLSGKDMSGVQISSVDLNQDLKKVAADDKSMSALKDAIKKDASANPEATAVALDATQKEAKSQVAQWGNPKNILNNMKNGFAKIGGWFKDGFEQFKEKTAPQANAQTRVQDRTTSFLQQLPFYRESVVPNFDANGQRQDVAGKSRRGAEFAGEQRGLGMMNGKDGWQDTRASDRSPNFKENATAEFMSEFVRGGSLYGKANTIIATKEGEHGVETLHDYKAFSMNVVAAAGRAGHDGKAGFAISESDLERGVLNRYDSIGKQIGIEDLGQKMHEAFTPPVRVGDAGYADQLRKQADLYEQVESKFKDLTPTEQLRLNYELADSVDPMANVEKGTLRAMRTEDGQIAIRDGRLFGGRTEYGQVISEGMQGESQAAVDKNAQHSDVQSTKDDFVPFDSYDDSAMMKDMAKLVDEMQNEKNVGAKVSEGLTNVQSDKHSPIKTTPEVAHNVEAPTVSQSVPASDSVVHDSHVNHDSRVKQAESLSSGVKTPDIEAEAGLIK